MLKTDFRAFIYSFSVSLFAIVGANKAFFCEKNPSEEPLNIQNKTIALYLAKPQTTHAPVKKIALNSLSDIEKAQTPPPAEPKQEIILASNLEPMAIPLEFVEASVIDEVSDVGADKNPQDKIVLADVLYAPNIPLPEQKIEADPIYTPEKGLEIKIIDDPVYLPDEENLAEQKITPPPAPKKEIVEDSSLILARNEKTAEIPLLVTKSDSKISKVQLGSPEDLQHIAYADKNVPIEAMIPEESSVQQKNSTDNKNWNPMSASPWVVAKSTGSKNVFASKNYADKSDKEISDALSINTNKKGVLLTSETAKNLIIPIPEEILNEKDISPRLAYPLASEDKQKEIDINEKIKNSEKLKEAQKKKSEEEKKSKEEEKSVLTAIEDELDKNLFAEPKPVEKKETETVSEQNPGIVNTLTSIFNKPQKPPLESKLFVAEKLKAKREALRKRKHSGGEEVNIMPTEIRLSFQPNKAEISGQTLRWVQAFATKVAQTSGLSLEVRIDGTSTTKLQQKRLNLLYNILTNKGLDHSLINTVFTSRDPNSFILRTIKMENNKQGVNNQKTNRYIQW